MCARKELLNFPANVLQGTSDAVAPSNKTKQLWDRSKSLGPFGCRGEHRSSWGGGQAECLRSALQHSLLPSQGLLSRLVDLAYPWTCLQMCSTFRLGSTYEREYAYFFLSFWVQVTWLNILSGIIHFPVFHDSVFFRAEQSTDELIWDTPDTHTLLLHGFASA